MPDRPPCKAQLRAQMRRRRLGLSPSAQSIAARAITNYIPRLPCWTGADRVALYLANAGEVDTTPLGALCRTAGKRLFLPVIEPDNTLVFAAWAQDGELIPNRFGIPEPPPEAERCAASGLDIIFLPLVAWDRLGGRLGMGGGFYDRTLAGVEGVTLVGLAHALQEVPQVPCDDWDVQLNFVVTDTALHHCQGAGQHQDISPG